MPADFGPAETKGQPGIGQAALFGLCPQCGQRTLFRGVVQFADGCRTCGLEFSRFNVGDGPAAFLTLAIGGLVVALALWLEVAAHPPFWVHALIWLPFTIAAVLGGLRVAKAALLAAEYRNRAGEAISAPSNGAPDPDGEGTDR
ncbi:MAG TPA: DUF983 domain-containing protein [Erythrobacter sp.]|nr:DUF983 domain-containing protein [Erythrobacter sp.]